MSFNAHYFVFQQTRVKLLIFLNKSLIFATIRILEKMKIQIFGIPTQERLTVLYLHVQKIGNIARMNRLVALIYGVVSLFTPEVDT